jgi:hypothetical protein
MIDKVKYPAQGDYLPLVPVLITDLDEVRAFSDRLNEVGKAWVGEAFGFSAGNLMKA